MGSACDHDHDEVLGLTGARLQGALAAAQARFDATGERMTAPRRRVLELLLEAGQPVKAYDLISAYGQDGRPAKPPTVYRALEFLERTGTVHRIASISAYVACAHDDQDHAAAFLICDCCGDTREIDPPAREQLAVSASKAGYQIARVTIEAHGLCHACQSG